MFYSGRPLARFASSAVQREAARGATYFVRDVALGATRPFVTAQPPRLPGGGRR